MTAALSSRFDAAMTRLGPFECRPLLAVAVSGGADSLSLAILANDWVRAAGGSVVALTVDHGLRPESAGEAAQTRDRLAALGIPGEVLTLGTLGKGAGLADRARRARYRALMDACARNGRTHLLLGHHRADQVETVMQRVLSASGGRGLAGMAALTETGGVRLLRPLLDIPPGALRAFLSERGLDWVEDPSNTDPNATRARLRLARADPLGTSAGTGAVAMAAQAAGWERARRDETVAAILAERAEIRPEGFALLSPGRIDPEGLSALLMAISGAVYPPPIDRTAVLARDLAPATLWGVRILAAGRLGPGWLLVREARAMVPAVPACPNAVWDGRFRLVSGLDEPCAMLGPLGEASTRFRDRGGLPAAVLRGLPAIWDREGPIAVPHLGHGDPRWRVVFSPRNPATCAPFVVG